jgi:poly(3-hydroxybutyrate) depolymerase
MMVSLFSCKDKETVSKVEPEEKIELTEGAGFELVENIGVEGSAFYLYSPSNPHNFSMLSGFLNSVIFVYPDAPYADEAEALAELQDLGLLDVAEAAPAFIVMPMPIDGKNWSEADLKVYYESQFYLAGGDITSPEGRGMPTPQYDRRTYNTLQYVMAEGKGATFVNNVLSQNAGRIAGILTFGGEIDAGIDPGYAVPAYLVEAGDAAVSYWKTANGVDTEPTPGIFVNSAYVQKRVMVAAGGDIFDRTIFTDAWNRLLSRSTRSCISANLVLDTRVLGEWILMTWPNLDELGVTLTTHTNDGFLVHDFVPETVKNNPDTPVPLVVVLHGMGDDPMYTVKGLGWADVAAANGFVVVSPDYNSQYPDQILSVVEYAKAAYPIDESRIYVTGFSMGGGTTGKLGLAHPEVFAAMSPMGATGGTSAVEKAAEFDIPLCIIVGSVDTSNVVTNDAGQKVIRGIENGALESLLDFNEIDYGTTDYDATPYWGYKPDSFAVRTDKELSFEINSFRKDGYTNPPVQLVTFIGAGHANADYMSTIAWDFMKRYSRGKDGSVIER